MRNDYYWVCLFLWWWKCSKIYVVMVAQLYEYTKIFWIIYFQWANCIWYVDYLSITLFFKNFININYKMFQTQKEYTESVYSWRSFNKFCHICLRYLNYPLMCTTVHHPTFLFRGLMFIHSWYISLYFYHLCMYL